MCKKELSTIDMENEELALDHCCCCEGHECDCEDIVCCCEEDCTCACHDELFNYKGTTYSVNFSGDYCEDMEECECNKPNFKTIALVGAGVAAASGILFYAIKKKKK